MGCTVSAEKEATYEHLATFNPNPIKICRFPAAVTAEVVPYGKNVPGGEESLQILNRFMGVGESPNNSEKQQMSMILPYLVSVNEGQDEEMEFETKDQDDYIEADKTGETMHHGSAYIVICNVGQLSCFLPSEIVDPTTAPQPVDKRIELNQLPPRSAAVRSFEGHFDRATVARNANALMHDLISAGYLPAKTNTGFAAYSVAHYKPGKPFGSDKPQSNYRYEIWVSLPSSPILDAVLNAHKKRTEQEISYKDWEMVRNTQNSKVEKKHIANKN